MGKVAGVGVILCNDKCVENRSSNVSTIVTDPVEEDFATASTCVETPTAVNDRGAEVTILEAVPSGL